MPNRTGELASKAMGAMKSVKATFEGLTGVFKQLTHEHGEVTALLLRVKMSSDPKVRRELFPKIRTELMAHERGELEVVYPAFLRYPELESIARHHQAEAGELEQLLAQLGTFTYDDQDWVITFNKLVERVSHHAKEEENTFFPAAQRIFGREETERLNTRYLAVQAEWKNRIS
jgi:hemerythrin superfamily protein